MVGHTTEVAIIGAGFAGASTAHHLIRRGLRDVLVLEREHAPGLHASGKNAALVYQLISTHAEARLAIEGAAFYRSPPEDFSTTRIMKPVSSLLVGSESARGALQAARRDAAALGLDVRVIDGD